jgi:hypothetical protein
MLWLTTAISETPPGGTWKVGRSNSVRGSQLLHLPCTRSRVVNLPPNPGFSKLDFGY